MLAIDQTSITSSPAYNGIWTEVSKIITHPFINPIDTAITTILNKVNNLIRGTSFLNKDKIIGIKNIQVAIKSSTIQYSVKAEIL